MGKRARIWVVDDDASIRWVLERALSSTGFEVRVFETAEAALQALADGEPAVLLTDIRMPGMSGLQLLDRLKTSHPELPVIITTAHTDLDSAVSSYQAGAFEYLPKPFDIDDALGLVKRALDDVKGSSVEPVSGTGESRIIGKAPSMQELFRAIGRLSGSHMNVLLVGESGTGKELVATAVYENSPRLNKPYIVINTAAIPAELLESELFGHEKGAFTGANSQRRGRFEQAHGGTLFLDEIGDMPPALQTRLLRVLADGKFYRVGGHEQISVDVRIIAATNQNLEKQVKAGRFREDLYHRLNVIRIALPALRERSEDIHLLIPWFLQRVARELSVEAKKVDTTAMFRLVEFDWPGNVRQLENICRWLTVMAPGSSITELDLPDELQADKGPGDSKWEQQLRGEVSEKLKRGEQGILEELSKRFEAVLLQSALLHTRGRKQEAARKLGWGRNTLARKIRELDIDS